MMMNTRHVCMIDRFSTTLAAVGPEPSSNRLRARCQRLGVGFSHLEGDRREKGMKKIIDILARFNPTSVSLIINPGRLHTLETLHREGTPCEMFDSQCRIEASHYFKKPEHYTWEHIPFDISSRENDATGHELLIYYPATTLRELQRELSKQTRISDTALYLKSLVAHSLLSGKEEALLELEPDTITFWVSCNGRLREFFHHRTRNTQETEFFSIHELSHKRQQPLRIAKVTGTLASNRSLLERIAERARCRLEPFQPVTGLVMDTRTKNICRNGSGLKAVSAALVARTAEEA
ncbi:MULTISPECIES: hypothetical protein [Prosthecochloris]|uniref:Uncharacterized protein n=1 Tax=Prosthecochloris vibrioformis TaxID=1098 RepID=A0A5C4S381_PROVB|nr:MULTISPECIES: hypothetical protein [Prosthecochloris]TNJ37874.1 hypothetical protein FGF68_01465 [Prosthecochloris vibrioformis]